MSAGTKTQASFSAKFGVPSDVGVANAEGVAALFVRQDHVHNHPAGLGANLHHNQVHGVGDHTDVQRSFFYPVPNQVANSPAKALINRHIGVSMTDGVELDAFLEGKVPSDFVSIVHIHPVVVPRGTGDLLWGAYVNYAAGGEANDIHAQSGGIYTDAVTAFRMTELQNCSASVLTLITKNDYFGFQFENKADLLGHTVNDIVYYLGLLIEYTAEQ